MKRSFKRLSLALLALITPCFAWAAGESISLNAYRDASGAITKDGAGVLEVPAVAWNNVTDEWNVGALKVLNIEKTSTSLIGVGGVYSGPAPWQLQSGYTSVSGEVSKTTANGEMFYNYLDSTRDGDNSSISINNIPFSQYTVYIYPGSEGDGYDTYGQMRSFQVTAGETSKIVKGSTEEGTIITDNLTDTWGTNASFREKNSTAVTFTEGVNYLKVEGLSGDLTITYPCWSGSNRAGIAAIQILNTGDLSIHQTIDWTDSKEKQISDLPEITSTTVELKLAADAILTLNEQVKEIGALQIKSTGNVTIKSTGDQLTNVDAIDCSGVEGIVTFDVENVIGDVVAKFVDLDVIKKTGTLETTLTSNAGLSNKQIIVAGGKLEVNCNLQNISATAEKPMIATGTNTEVKFVGESHEKNRMPDNGYVKAEDNATIVLRGVNLFADNKGPNVLLDKATLKAEMFGNSDSHIKVTSVTMANNSTIQISQSVPAWNSEGLFLCGNNNPRLVVMSGENNTIEYLEDGTAENILKIQSGIIDIAQGAKLTLATKVTSGTNDTITKTGNGALIWNSPSDLAIDVSSGELIFNSDVTLTKTITGDGTIVVDGCTVNLSKATLTDYTGAFTLVNNGTLILPAGKEDAITVPAGCTLKLALSESQLATEYKAVNVTVADGATFVFVDNKGNTIENGVTNMEYVCPYPIWEPVDAKSIFENEACWTDNTKPANGDIVINTSAYDADISVTIPSGYTTVTVNANTTHLTTVHFTDDVSVYPKISVVGQVALPIAVINAATLSIADNSLLVAEVLADAEEFLTKEISGNYTFGKSGAGTLVLNANVTAAHGTEILAGTLKFGQVNTTKYTIGGTEYGTQGNVKVHTDAVLDVNGVADAYLNMVTLCEGAVFANDGTSELSNGSRQLKGITLEGNATVRATKNFGILASGHAQSTLNLGGKTLTKTGDGSFWLSNTDVSNGTLKVVAGNFTGVNTAPRFANVTFESDSDNAFASIGNGAISGTIGKDGTSKLTLLGTVANPINIVVKGGSLTADLANRKLNNFEVASGATLKLTLADGDVWNYDTATTGLVNGTLEVAGKLSIGSNNKFTLGDGAVLTTTRDITEHSYDFFANNTIVVNGAATIKGLFGTQDYTGNNPTRTLTIQYGTTGAKLTIAEAAIKSNQILTTALAAGVTSGTLEINSALTTSKTLTIASGVALSGTGSWGGPVTFENNAIVDATANAITVGGAITQSGTLTIKVKAGATVGDTILTGADGSSFTAETITIADRTDVKAVVAGTTIKLATAAVCKIDNTEYFTLAKALEDATSGTVITMVADSDENITLPAGVKLVMGEYKVASVKDVYGANLTADADGNYTGPTYVATVTPMYSETQVGYTSFQDAVTEAAGTMGTATLLTDLTIESPIEVNAAGIWSVIDLGGKTLTATGSSAFFVKAGNPAIKNGTINATSVGIWICEKVMSADVAPFDFESNETGNASVTLDSTLTVTSSTDNCVLMYNGAVLSTAATLTSSGEYATIQGTGLNANNATMITITGGSVTSKNNHAIYHPQPGTLTISGGTISGKTGIEMRAGTLQMSAGTVTATGTYAKPDANNSGSTVTGAAIALSQHTTDVDITATITGGKVTCAEDGKTLVVANTTTAAPVSIFAGITSGVMDIDAVEILVDSLMLVKTEKGNYTTTAVVATIGKTKYASLPLAFAAANEDKETADEITIAAEASIELDAAIEVTTKVTLNLNGALIRMTEKDTEGNGVFHVTDGGDLTINGDGTLVPLGKNDYCMAIWADGGKVTINGGTYNNLMTNEEAASKKDSNHFDLIYAKRGGQIVINGGHFLCQTPAWTLNSHDTLRGNIIVQGGTFKEFDPANCATEGEGTNWCAAGYYSTISKTVNGVDYYTVKAAEVPKAMGDTNFSDAAKAALIDAAVEAKTSITSVVAGGDQTAATIDAALALFDGIVTVDTTTGEATVDWDFGISDIKVNRNEYGSLEGTVNIMATVKNKKGDDNAGYADGVAVTFYADGDALDTYPLTVASDGTATLTVDIKAINGKELKVKASNEVTNE